MIINMQSGHRDGIWNAMLIMKSSKRYITYGMELPNQKKKKSECSEKTKLTINWEYWKLPPSNKWRWKKKLKKSISGEQENYLKQNFIAGTLSKGCFSRKILRAILEVDQRRSWNGPENKKTNDHA